MTYLPEIVYLYVSYTNGCPVVEKQITIQTLALNPYTFGLTDESGFVEIPVSKNNGKVIIDGKTVYYGSLTSGRIDIELRKACPELPD